MASLGGLFVRALLRKPTNSYYTTIPRRLNSSRAFHRSSNLYPLRVLHFSGYTENKKYHTEVEANKRNNASTGKDVIRSISKGDIINLNDLLFTKDRDYLVKSNNEHVKADHLEGKVIGIYLLPLCIYCSLYGHAYPSLLKDMYSDLQSVNNFEVVMVAYNHSDAYEDWNKPPWELFEDYFSSMPWTAIPYSDKASRKRIQSSFGVTDYGYPSPTMFVVDPTGMVLQCHAWDIFENFGSLGYPFSDERIEILRAEEAAAAKHISLKTLLSSPQRDYVISNKGDKVPIQTLEDKVVALYFYNVDNCDSLTETLKSFYEELKKTKKNFEVVLVYIKESQYEDWDREESYWKKFKTMPWLALPYGEKTYKKFREVLKLPTMVKCESKIVIIGPHGEFIETYGDDILFWYNNISTYPFTRKEAAELDTEKLKELKLDMLWDPRIVFRRNNGSEVSFSQLSGKRVMLIFESFVVQIYYRKGSRVENNFGKYASPNTKFLMMLKRSYLQKLGSDDEFEVIRIFIPELNNYTRKSLGSMPNWSEPLGDTPWLISLPNNLGATTWLVSLANELKHDLGSYFFKDFSYDCLDHYLPIFAFDRDGRLVRETIFPTFEDTEFPFYSGSLKEEKLSELTKLFSRLNQ